MHKGRENRSTSKRGPTIQVQRFFRMLLRVMESQLVEAEGDQVGDQT